METDRRTLLGHNSVMNRQDFVEVNPEVMTGQPVIKGTRNTVAIPLERLGGVWTDAQILDAYPHLKPKHIRAARA